MPILSTVPEKSLTVKEGEDVRIECRLSKGNPKPRLFWRKKYKQSMSGIKIMSQQALLRFLWAANCST